MYANRLLGIKPSKSMAMAQKVQELSKTQNILDLTWGQPDFDTPDHIKQAAINAILSGKNGYTPSSGILELRKAISKYYELIYGTLYDPDSQILVTPGVKQGLMYIMQAIINPGDEVILFEPYWLSYTDMIAFNSGIPKAIPASMNLRPDVDVLENAITPKTKAIVINNPINPSGYIYNYEELLHIVQLAEKFGLYIISDEIYGQISFKKFISMVEFENIRENLILANGFSKAYAMTGWRVGYLLGPESVISKISLIHQHTATCASSPSQYAALAAIEGEQKSVHKMTDTYMERRNVLVAGLKNTLFKVIPSDGTFYMMVQVPELPSGYTNNAVYLLNEFGIACVNGQSYGESASKYVRFSLTLSEKQILDVIARLDYKKKK